MTERWNGDPIVVSEDTQPEEEETEIPQSDEAREELVAEIEKESVMRLSLQKLPQKLTFGHAHKEAWLDTARILLRCNMKYFTFSFCNRLDAFTIWTRMLKLTSLNQSRRNVLGNNWGRNKISNTESEFMTQKITI